MNPAQLYFSKLEVSQRQSVILTLISRWFAGSKYCLQTFLAGPEDISIHWTLQSISTL